VSTDPPRVDKGGMIEVIWPRGERAFLRQSNQLYKQMVIASGMDKIFEIGPFWRAETENSFRHLQETIGLDVEISNPKNLNTIIDLAYSIICDSYYQMKEMSLPLAELNLPKNKPPIISYKEAVDLLNSNGFSCSYGSDLGVIGEAKLGEVIKKKKDSDIFVISHYPSNIKKFYTKQGTSFLTETFDIILCGWELVSGAIRENNRKKIEYSMKLANINVADYAFYLSIVDNSVGHGGFGLGLDRLIAKFLDIAVIDNCVPFPRTFEKLIP
jgi:aspartyl-tRNA synthetase